MAGETERSIIAFGRNRASLAVTLPKDWVKFFRIRAGEKMRVKYDNILVIIPPHPQRDLLEAKVRRILLEE